MKIRNKYKNSIHEIIEENDDIENLTEGEKFYRVWKDGEFQLYEVPIVQKDGSIILPKDTLSNVSEEVESNIDIKSCLLYTSPSPRDVEESRMPSSA